jgi:hypothetical protein
MTQEISADEERAVSSQWINPQSYSTNQFDRQWSYNAGFDNLSYRKPKQCFRAHRYRSPKDSKDRPAIGRA